MRDSFDKYILLSQMVLEISIGDCSIDGAQQRRENGGYCVLLVVDTGAMSVFAVVAARSPRSQLIMSCCLMRSRCENCWIAESLLHLSGHTGHGGRWSHQPIS